MFKQIFKTIIVYILTLEARLVLRKYKPTIVAVTGNVGKTSTKDAIFTVLSRAYYVRKSEKSFNSDIGVPLTILGLPNAWHNPLKWVTTICKGFGVLFLKNHYPKWLVLEVGADRPGDIKRIASWLSPDVVVMTKIGEVPVHVEYFSSAEEVAREKRYLVEALKPSGLLVLDVDNPFISFIKEKNRAKVVTFGISENADVYASNAQVVYSEDGKPTGMTFKANYSSSSVPVRIENTIGFHLLCPALAAFAVAIHNQINLISAVEWIREYENAPGRLRVISGVRGSTILDDSYNASPIATSAGLSTLKEIETTGRKIAVLGDMLELGKHTADEHKKIGTEVAESADVFYAVGMRMEEATHAALAHNMPKENIYTFADAREAGEALKKEIQKNDVVLIKGSQSMRMERVIECIMAHPEQKRDLLVRQDPDWLAKP